MAMKELRLHNFRFVEGRAFVDQLRASSETFPEFMDALMPLACNTIPIAGRNRIVRKLAIDAILNDPGYSGGEYKTQPEGLNTAIGVLAIMIGRPLLV